MIDDDDVAWVAWLWPSGGGVFGAVLGVLVIGGVAYVACQNDAECAQRECPHGGVARVIGHECICAEAPSK